MASRSEAAQQNLQDHFTDHITLNDAIDLDLNTLKQVIKEKLNSTNVVVMTITPENVCRKHTHDEVEEIIARMALVVGTCSSCFGLILLI